MRQLKTIFAVIGAATVLVLAANTVALAATGQALLLGKSNSANTVTAVSRTTSGSVLKLQSATSASAPLTVNGTGKVANLNADKVDGYDSSSMLNQTRVYKKSIVADGSPSGGFSFTTGAVPAGNYLLNGSGWIYGPSSGSPGLECYLKSTSPSLYREWFSPTNGDGFYTLALGGVVTLSTSQTLDFACSGPSYDYNTFDDMPITITLTKIGQVVNGSVSARVKPGAARSASR